MNDLTHFPLSIPTQAGASARALPDSGGRDSSKMSAEDQHLFETAQKLEASFLTHMLKSAGFYKPREGFGSGGAGEEHFSSFLREAHAQALVQNGGIGLAESLFNSLKQQSELQGQATSHSIYEEKTHETQK